LFLLAGVFVLGSALYNGPRFYPALSDRTPQLANAGLAVATGGISGILVLAAWGVAMLGAAAPDPSPVVALLSLLLMLVGLCLFGVAVLRTGAYPKPVGGLLLGIGYFLATGATMAGRETPSAA
jgi:hypothetical protein